MAHTTQQPTTHTEQQDKAAGDRELSAWQTIHSVCFPVQKKKNLHLQKEMMICANTQVVFFAGGLSFVRGISTSIHSELLAFHHQIRRF
jgi:hypothetical protein